MEVTGLLHGSRLLRHVDFPCPEVLGPGASEDEIQVSTAIRAPVASLGPVPDRPCGVGRECSLLCGDGVAFFVACRPQLAEVAADGGRPLRGPDAAPDPPPDHAHGYFRAFFFDIGARGRAARFPRRTDLVARTRKQRRCPRRWHAGRPSRSGDRCHADPDGCPGFRARAEVKPAWRHLRACRPEPPAATGAPPPGLGAK